MEAFGIFGFMFGLASITLASMASSRLFVLRAEVTQLRAEVAQLRADLQRGR